jgi:hypothetical protein
MSSNDMNFDDSTITQINNNSKYSKDSFDRFGDDLCELLLSYLRVEQKLFYECVSKQWKTLIFNKQQKLSINLFPLKESTAHQNIGYISLSNDNSLKELVKKFAFITELSINTINCQILDIITNNCLHLKKIELNLDHCSHWIEGKNFNLTQFGRNCGQKLEFIQIKQSSEVIKLKELLLFTPNLKKVYINYVNKDFKFYPIKEYSISPFSEEFLQKLQEICFMYSSFDELKTFSDKYHKQIKKIGITFAPVLQSPNDGINNALIELSRFECLESLVLNINNRNYSNYAISSGLKLIADNCKKLNHLEIFMDQNNISGKIFELLKETKALEKLIITINDQNFGPNFSSVEYLKNCKNLKYLKLDFKGFGNDILEDIDLYLPNLTHFLFINPMNVLPEKTLHNLTKLKNLSHIDIDSYSLCDSEVYYFIKNSLNIEKMIFRNINYITRKTINVLIERAIKRPKVQYLLQFKEKFKNTENLELIDYSIAPNLTVKASIGKNFSFS